MTGLHSCGPLLKQIADDKWAPAHDSCPPRGRAFRVDDTSIGRVYSPFNVNR
jgi:hypothetical protein